MEDTFDSVELINEIATLPPKEQIRKIALYVNKYVQIVPELCIPTSRLALKIAEENSLHKEKAEIYKFIAEAHHKLKNIDESLKYYHIALELFENYSDIKSCASVEYQIAVLHHIKGNLDDAKQMMQKSCEKYDLIGDKKDYYDTLFAFGNILYHASYFDKALKVYNKCLSYAKQTSNEKFKANCLNDVGLVYLAQSNLEKALKCFLESLNINDRIGDTKSLFIPLSNIGNIYFYLNEFEKALTYYKRSIELLDKNEEKKNFSLITNNMGSLYFQLGKYDEAEKCFKNSLEIKRILKHKKGIALTLSNLGEICAFKKDWKRALEYYTESIILREKMNDKKGIAHTYLKIAKAKIALGKFEECLPNLDIAENIAKEINVKSLLEHSLQIRSEYYFQIENYKQAYLFYEKHINLRDQILNQQTKQKIADMQTKYKVEKKEREAEIYRLKNIELAKANEEINLKNRELNAHKEHLKLINKILRHDLINNLASIKSSLNIFQYEQDEKVLDSAYVKIKKSTNLIRRMHDLENILSTNKNLDIMNARTVIEKVISTYKDMHISISGNCKVLADNTLNSVIENIIGNSKRHSKSNKIDILISEKAKYAQIKISDFGIGIPDDFKEKIFEESFVMGESAHTGLGLYIVKKAIENCNGFVYAEDNVPQGTSIIIMLNRIK
ncbi:MAG: tetratricopeptide repeat-containing sensor histidine kinase [Candidatus Cloacimonetes bacterium]|nr:tetratricopeptide repeat-containing sensor histidine kinase [Candidatus Cloacimonadota bacterium]